MAEPLDPVPDRITIVEQKIDALSLSVDRRFDEVREHFVEQREYIEFAFGRLDQKMDVRFAQIDARLAQMDVRFERMDVRLAQMDARFERMDARLAQMERRFGQMDGRFDRLERKLDSLIDRQIRASRASRSAHRRKKR